MVQEFHVLRCFSCELFQVQQVKKVSKWSCKVCGQKQSVIKEFGRGSGADCRRHVQKLNAARGAKMEEDAEHRPKMDDQSLWSETDEEEQLLSKPVSRWDKYLSITQEEAGLTPEEEAEPEETAVVMDRDLLSSSKQRVKQREPDSHHPRKRRRTDQDVSAPGRPSRSLPPQTPRPPESVPSVVPPRPPESVPSVVPPRPPESVPSVVPPRPPESVPSVVPPRAISKWRAFLNKPHTSEPGSGTSASVMFQSGEDLDLSWSEDWT